MISKPPYTITEKAADYLAKIVESSTRLEFGTNFKRNISLHRKNRIRTVHSSVAIEGNMLSLGEVTALLNGKRVIGNQNHIKEVKNAYSAYEKIEKYNPYLIKDFLKAHRIMTEGLVEESGVFQSGNVGVFDGNVVVHLGARPQFVPDLMGNLFAWGKESELHPVLKSAIIHYEIETIHPFADGNGRMGRLWQSLILAKWNSLFAWVPMESLLFEKRNQYYEAIESSRNNNDSSFFIEFTLLQILESLEKISFTEHDNEHDTEHDERENRILEFCKTAKTREEIQAHVGISHREYFRSSILKPLLDSGKLKMTLPDKPKSKNQKYIAKS